MERYNKYIELGDKAITRSTAYRYRDTISPLNNTVEEHNLEEIISEEVLNEFEIPNVEEQTPELEFTNDLAAYFHEIFLQDITEKSLNSSKCKNLEDMLNSKEFYEQKSIAVNTSQAELLLTTLKFSVANNLSVTGMTNLFKLFNNIFEESLLPNSRYLVDALLNPQGKIEFHAVCEYCMAYVGKFDEIASTTFACRICTNKLNLKNSGNTSFFVLIDPSSQIKDLMTLHEKYYEYVIKERRHESNQLKDIYDGKEYRKFVDSLSNHDRYNYISAVFNTDGASKFKCSRYSIWPLYLMLNELPKQERMSQLITCGLWFNKQKPDMSIFLGTFVDVLNKLTTEGISCIINKEERLLKLFVVNCCVDSVARAPIQGIKQFNGNFGCSWCLHPGIWCDNAMKYTLLETSIAPRNHESTIKDMFVANPDIPINGIKYPSPLINLLNFDIISGFVPDYMHCCLEGVAKQFTEYYITFMNKEDITEIDFKLNHIAAPHQISRLSRPITQRNEWKAREWENYVLYYSVPILSEHLSRNYFQHWLLFVQSVYILLKDSINSSELNQANVMLHEFVADTEMLFGPKAMTYNVHQLLHLSESVMNWGPLWCHSTFSFESANHNLLKAIKSAKGVPSQIVRYVNIIHYMKVLQEYSYPFLSETIKMYCDDILSSKVYNSYKTSNVTYFGKGESVDDFLLAVDLNLSDSANLYFKIVKNGCLFESSSNSKRRSNNSFVLLNNNNLAQIDKFIVDNGSMQELTICNIVRTRDCFNSKYKSMKIVEEIESDSTVIATNDIKTICICMQILGTRYILPLPNLLHY